nr:uncharacterized protein LOC109026538 [Gorilla gorilla gorilla]
MVQVEATLLFTEKEVKKRKRGKPTHEFSKKQTKTKKKAVIEQFAFKFVLIKIHYTFSGCIETFSKYVTNKEFPQKLVTTVKNYYSAWSPLGRFYNQIGFLGMFETQAVYKVITPYASFPKRLSESTQHLEKLK